MRAGPHQTFAGNPLQSKRRLPAPRPALPRPRHQLLLLLTKVSAAQSQGGEVVLVEVVEYFLPDLLRELVQTLGILDLPRLVLVLCLASFYGSLVLGPGAGGRRSLSRRQ